jgi:hypothetical protein
MGAMPTFGLSETVAYAVMSAPACVSALKIVVFPAFGSPTMPTSSASGVRRYATAPKPTRDSRAKRLT